MYALVDCNNFYVSCERVFQPRLKGKPVIVLSNNDGCVIARSDEAKKLDIKMGAPYFKIRSFASRHGVHVRSSNYELYGDMSRRVMQTLEQLTSDVEVYSIDEAFCDLSGFLDHDLVAYANTLRDTIYQWTGIPVSIGIASTKTLAKAANQVAKRSAGVFVLAGEANRREVLSRLGVRDIWGIGRRHEKLLASFGIRTALEFADQRDSWVRHHMHVTGLRTAHELRGIPCIQIEEPSAAKQSIATSRMFGRPITELHELLEAIVTYTTRAAEKLREEKRQARHIDIFFHTSPFKQPYYSGRAAYGLPTATDFTPTLIAYAVRGVRSAFRPGHTYIKAGLILFDFTAPEEQQLSLLNAPNVAKHTAAMHALDAINQRWGENTLFYAGAGTQQLWRMKREMRSRSYSTRINEILVVT